jgi:hypothetical protein
MVLSSVSANANADLAGSLAVHRRAYYLASLTSRGVDPKVVNTKGEAS